MQTAVVTAVYVAFLQHLQQQQRMEVMQLQKKKETTAARAIQNHNCRGLYRYIDTSGFNALDISYVEGADSVEVVVDVAELNMFQALSVRHAKLLVLEENKYFFHLLIEGK